MFGQTSGCRNSKRGCSVSVPSFFHSGRGRSLRQSGVMAVVLLAVVGVARAGGPIAPGDDLWVTPAGGTYEYLWELRQVTAGTGFTYSQRNIVMLEALR